MNKAQLNQRLEDLKLTQKEFASIIGYSHQSVKQWKDGTIPKWVGLVLNYLDGFNRNEEQFKRYLQITHQLGEV